MSRYPSLSIVRWLAPLLLCPVCLADECTLAAGRCPLRSADNRTCLVKRQEITQPVWWPLFCHRRANTVKQSAWTALATGHHLRTIKTIVENVCVWLVVRRRPVSERLGRWLEIFLLTYLQAPLTSYVFLSFHIFPFILSFRSLYPTPLSPFAFSSPLFPKIQLEVLGSVWDGNWSSCIILKYGNLWHSLTDIREY